jgi:hypothetical protein
VLFRSRTVQHDISHFLFVVYGTTPLSDEPKGDPSKHLLTLLANSSYEILRAPCKFTQSKNALAWVALARDPFGGWTIVNLRIGLAKPEADLVAIGNAAATAVLKS